MHPPFYIPDVRIADDITPHHGTRRLIKRGDRPQRLPVLPVPGWPPLPFRTPDWATAKAPTLPTGRPVMATPVLAIVPKPRNTLRDSLGRFLIRTGQRMILENGPG